MPSRRLILLRHGQTHSNVSGSLDTAIPGADLTELGVRQAGAAAVALDGVPIDALHVSRLVRTHQTAAPTVERRGLTPEATPGLEEISAGDLEMASDDDAVRVWHRTLAAWFAGDLTPRVPGGESGEEFLARYDEAIASTLRPGATTLVVSHGAAIRLWTHSRVAPGEAMPDLDERIDNTGAFTVDLPEGARVADRAWGLVSAHLDPLGGDLLSDHSDHDPTGDPV